MMDTNCMNVEPPRSRFLEERIAELEAQLAELKKTEPVKFLLDNSRLKLSFFDVTCPHCGKDTGDSVCVPIDQYRKELEGEWVALVPAANDQHLRMVAAPVVQQKAEPVADVSSCGNPELKFNYGAKLKMLVPASGKPLPLYAAPVVPDGMNAFESLEIMLQGAMAHADHFGNGNVATATIRKLIAAAQEGKE